MSSDNTKEMTAPDVETSKEKAKANETAPLARKQAAVTSSKSQKQAAGILQTLRQFEESLEKDLASNVWLAPLSRMSVWSGVARTKLLMVGAMVMMYACTIGFGGVISNMIGFVYPAYRSYKAIKTEGKADDTQWLTYWVVYAFFTVFDGICGAVFSWVPFYFFIKIAFLVWCMHPRTNGATIILRVVIAPLVTKYEASIDEAGLRLSSVFQRQAQGARGHVDTMIVAGMQKGMYFAARAKEAEGDTLVRRFTGEYLQGECNDTEAIDEVAPDAADAVHPGACEL